MTRFLKRLFQWMPKKTTESTILSEYRLIMDNLPDAVYLLDGQGTIRDANRKALELTGYSLSELQGKNFREIDNSCTDRFPVEGSLQKHLHQEALKRYGRHQQKDGMYFPSEVYLSYNLNPRNELVMASVRDITIRIQQEEILRARLRLIEYAADHSVNQLLRKFLDEAELLTGSKVGFYHFLNSDQETLSLQAWSTNTLQHMCQAEGEGLHYPVSKAGVWVDCIHEKKPVVHNDYQALPNRKGLPAGHAPVIRELVVPVVRGEKIVAILGVGNKETLYTQQDVSVVEELAELAWEIIDRNKAEEKALKLSKVVEQSPECIIITNQKGSIEYVNPKFVAVTGYSVREALGSTARILAPSNDPSNATRHTEIWNTITTGNIWQGEYLNRKKDDTTYWDQVSIIPLKDTLREIINYVIIHQDITEKKQMLFDLQQAKDKAEESDRLKTAFLNNMSHEIRTPLNGIIGFSNLLAKNILTSKEKIDYGEIITRSGNQLLHLVNDILDLAKIEAGQVTIYEEATDLCTICQEVLDMHQLSAQKKNIELRICNPSDCPMDPVLTDKAKLIQILSNLLHNAIKFTQQGSVQLACSLSNGCIQFSVSDTGIGIEEPWHSRIFDRFRQADNQANTQYGGTGLGLSICKGLVEQMGGSIGVHSEAGKGSTFYFHLPYKPAQQQPPKQALPQVPIDYSKYTVLIAEDEDTNYEYVNKVLGMRKLNLIHARNGQEAIDLFSKNKTIAMVLMDIKMPIMNGYDATRAIKKINRQVPIIAFTAHAFMEDKAKALLAGCDDYLAKPVDEEPLLETINRHLIRLNQLTPAV